MRELIEMLDPNLVYHDHQVYSDHIDIFVHSNRESVLCPLCGNSSSRIHSRYDRSFADLPIQGKEVHLHIPNRKYLCLNAECPRKVFAESFDFLQSNAKKTTRLVDKIMNMSLETSSVTASRLLKDEGVEVSKTTICNMLKKKTNRPEYGKHYENLHR
jgi:transposase